MVKRMLLRTLWREAFSWSGTGSGREVARVFSSTELPELDADKVTPGRLLRGVSVVVQGEKDGVDGGLSSEVGGVERELGEAGVEGVAAGEALFGGGGILEDRACNVLKHAAVEESGKGSVEEDGEGSWSLLDKKTIGEFFGGASTESEDGI